jgi:hypothetical protein
MSGASGGGAGDLAIGIGGIGVMPGTAAGFALGGMDFLQLCTRAAIECGVSGTLLTTAGQVGSLGRIVSWVADAWNEIQTARDDWSWMRASNILGSGVSFAPAAGQFNTPLGTGAAQVGIAWTAFGKWDEATFRCFTTANGTRDEIFLDCIDYDIWRDAYMLGAMRNVQTRPYVIAIGPDQSLNLGPPPNGNYTITGDYWTAPTVLVNDTDVPIGLATRWQMLIVYKAMFKYGYYEAAADVLERAQSEWDIMLRQVEARRLPAMGFGGAL